MHIRLKRGFVTLAILLLPVFASGRGINLASMNGWHVVVATNAIPSERYAATEFTNFVQQATGVTLPVVEKPRRWGKHVFIGISDTMPEAESLFDRATFGDEDFRIVISKRYICIAGGRPRGTLYGVYSFLEAELGIRFLTANHTYVPELEEAKIVLPSVRLYRPPFEFRCSYYGENRNTAFAVRLRNNANIQNLDRYGGTTRYRLLNHSVQSLLPTRRYGKEHPEYYALRGGERRWDVGGRDWAWEGTEPCFSNPEVIRILGENTLTQIEKDRKRLPGVMNISVSQNDNLLFCECTHCLAIDDAEGSHMGSVLKAVNAVADVVATQHPGMMVGTLAYRYSRSPPEITVPRPNVQIQLCSFESSQFQAIDDPTCRKNKSFCNDLEGWADMCSNIYVWHYNVCFRNYLLPCANLRKLDRDIRYFAANNVCGVLMQGAWNGFGSELSDLRHYLISHLLWDPSRDGEQLIDEFVTLHYGKAAPAIMEWIDYIHDRAEQSGLEPQCSQQPSSYGLDEDFARVGLALFDKAESRAESDGVRARVEKASLTVYRCAIQPVWDRIQNAVQEKDGPPKTVEPLNTKLGATYGPILCRFIQRCDTYGIDAVSEGLSYRDWRKAAVSVLGREP